MARYEDDFHIDAIVALSEQLGYAELWEDRLEATAARIDSIGTAGSLPCFVEVKLGVNVSTVRSIEGKIAGALRDFADDRPHPMVGAMKQVWADPATKPIISVVGHRYAKGASEVLAALLRQRGERWGFFWGVYEVAEGGAFQRLAENIDWAGGPRDAHVVIDPVKGPKQNRNPMPKLADFKARATTRESGSIIDIVLETADFFNLQAEMRQGFVTLMSQGKALVRLYAEADGVLLSVPKELTASMEGGGFERHAVDGAFRWSRFVIRSPGEAESFLQWATSPPTEFGPAWAL